MRRTLRNALLRAGAIDTRLGHLLVQIDAQLHASGVLRAFDESETVACHGLILKFRKEDAPFARTLYLNGDYEPATREAILERLVPGSTFVDLGAHVGYFSLLAGRRVGAEGHVYAFEPTPSTRQTLARNIASNRLGDIISIEPFASSDRPGKLRFLVTEASEGNAVALPNEVGPTIEVDATSLDTFFEARAWPRVDIVKMDVEGQELATLRGMKQLCRRNQHLAVIFEYHLGQIRRTQLDRLELFACLHELGFRRFSILFRKRTPIDLPARLDDLDAIAQRANVNILAEQ